VCPEVKNRLLFVLEIMARLTFSLGPPVVFKIAIDTAVRSLFRESFMYTFLYYGLTIFLLFILLLLGTMNRNIWPMIYINKVKSVLRSVLRDFLKRFNSGTLLSLVLDDTRTSATKHEIWMAMLYARVLRSFIALGVLHIAVGAKYSSISIVFISVLWILSWINRKISYKRINERRKELEDHYIDFLSGSKDIAGVGSFHSFYNVKKKYEDRYLKERMKYSGSVISLSSLSELARALYMIALLWFLLQDMLSGVLSLGMYFFVLQYTEHIADPVEALPWLAELKKQIKVGEEKIKGFEREMENIELGGKAATTVSSFKTLEVKNVSFSYAKKQVLGNVSFHAPKGEIVWIRGESGVGKTTLVKILSGLLKPFKGEVLLDGKCIFDMSRNDLTKKIRVLFQDSSHVVGSVKLNVDFLRNLSKKKIREAIEKAGIEDVEIDRELTDETGVSGGQLRRILFARTIAEPAEIFIFDEPFMGSDKGSKERMLETLSELKKHSIVIVVSHDEDMRDIADRVIELRRVEVTEEA